MCFGIAIGVKTVKKIAMQFNHPCSKVLFSSLDLDQKMASGFFHFCRTDSDETYWYVAICDTWGKVIIRNGGYSNTETLSKHNQRWREHPLTLTLLPSHFVSLLNTTKQSPPFLTWCSELDEYYSICGDPCRSAFHMPNVGSSPC